MVIDEDYTGRVATFFKDFGRVFSLGGVSDLSVGAIHSDGAILVTKKCFVTLRSENQLVRFPFSMQGYFEDGHLVRFHELFHIEAI